MPVMTLAFVAVNLAALIRVALPLNFPAAHAPRMTAAGLVWMAAFGLFAAIYTPILQRPQADGKPE